MARALISRVVCSRKWLVGIWALGRCDKSGKCGRGGEVAEPTSCVKEQRREIKPGFGKDMRSAPPPPPLHSEWFLQLESSLPLFVPLTLFLCEREQSFQSQRLRDTISGIHSTYYYCVRYYSALIWSYLISCYIWWSN